MAEIKKFEYEKMAPLVDRVFDMWSSPDKEKSFRRIYTEAIIRFNMHENDFQFMATENNELLAIACASKKGDKIRQDQWWQNQYENLKGEEQSLFKLNRDYLAWMNEKTYAFMTDNTIKLDLFMSVKKGSGKKILNSAMEKFRQFGYKNLVLWTDCECDVDWYFSNGYDLIDEDVFLPFSSAEKKFKTYIFKKEI